MSSDSEEDRSQIKGVEAAAKDAGFDSFKNFLESHGLALFNLDDVKEGRGILRSMGYGVSVD